MKAPWERKVTALVVVKIWEKEPSTFDICPRCWLHSCKTCTQPDDLRWYARMRPVPIVEAVSGNIFTIWATHSLTHSVPLTLVHIPRWLHSQVKEELVNTSIYFFIVFSNVRTPPVFSAYSLKTCLVNTNMPRPGPKLAIVFFLTFPFSTVKLVQAESGGGYQGYPNDPSYSSNPFSSSYPAPSSYPSYPFYAGYPSYPGYVGVAPSLPTYPVAYDKRQVTISHL